MRARNAVSVNSNGCSSVVMLLGKYYEGCDGKLINLFPPEFFSAINSISLRFIIGKLEKIVKVKYFVKKI